MTTQDHGKRISEIWYSGDGNTLDRRVKSDKVFGIELKLSATHHGDHDEFWVLLKNNNREIERYNVKYLSRIIWAE